MKSTSMRLVKEENSSLLNERPNPFPRGDKYKIAKIQRRHYKKKYSPPETVTQICTKKEIFNYHKVNDDLCSLASCF